jgi:hypothetical protein
MPPEICPHCGAVLESDARVCPECGSDEQTGWSDRATGQRLDLPDDEFDYDEFVREEFRAGQPKARSPTRWFWWVIALGLLLGFVAVLLRG